MQQVPHERQPTSLSAQRTAPDAQKEIVAGFESLRPEVPDQNFTLLVSILSNGVDHVEAQAVVCGEIAHLARPQLLCKSEFSPRDQPVREVIALAVVGDALGGHFVQHRLERIEVAGAPYRSHL